MNRKRLLPVAGAAALVAAVGVAAGCGGSTGTASPAATPAGQVALAPQQTVQTQPQLQVSPSAQAAGDPYELIPDIVEQVQPSIVSVLVQTGQGGAEGSGVVWDGSRGLIVTNNHVVEGGGEVQVRLSSGDRVPATVLATDPQTDLAVVQVDRTDLPTATFASDLPRVGELAVAMGNPLGFENSVTAGIVSALHRSLGEAPYNDLLQTDAPISPGNSGGALVNHDGEVIGINTAGIPTTENANSLGFAIPATTVERVARQLVANGQVSHPYLGVTSTDTDQGVVLQEVVSGSPAEAAGLQAGDTILAVDGTQVATTSELASALASHAVGDQVTLTVARGGQQTQLTATLGERPPAA
jgi:S1-C subfamily serine protease